MAPPGLPLPRPAPRAQGHRRRSVSRRKVLTLALFVVVTQAWLIAANHPGGVLTLGNAADVPPAGAATSVALTAGAAGQDERLNVVTVMADDMRVDDLAFAPNVRRLIGDRGLTFDNSFSPYPLCCPARASFLTGSYAHNHGVYWHERPYGYAAFDDSRTVATSLRRAGYRTGFVGKYLNGYGADRSLVSGGPSFRYVPRGWTDWIGAIENPGGRHGVHGGTYNYYDTPFNVDGRVDNGHRGEYQTDVLGGFATDLVTEYAATDQPFFLYVSYVAPHFGGPREADDPGLVRRSDDVWSEFKTPARPRWVRGRFDDRIGRGAGMPRGGGPAEANVSDKPAFFARLPELNRAERRALTRLTRQRAEAVYVMDRQVGRLVRTLKRTGEWDETVLMFTSDNGYFLGEHRNRNGKVRAHEPSLRVPFLVTGPGLRAGRTRYDPITTVDVTATILDIADARAPQALDGVSRWDTMRQGDQGWSTAVVTEGTHTVGGRPRVDGFPRGDPRTSVGLRTPRYSFTLYRNGAGELYDLVADPLQNKNLFKEPDHRAVRRDLTTMWWDYKDCRGRSCRAPMPEQFRRSSADVAALTRGYWRTIDRTYGW